MPTSTASKGMERQRLNTVEFQVLRSIARSPWETRGGWIQWRVRRKWVGRDVRGDPLPDAVWSAAYGLVTKGLVRVATLRCCPDCHNEREELVVSERGRALLERANVAHLPGEVAMLAPSEQVVREPAQAWWHRAVALFTWSARRGPRGSASDNQCS